MIRETTPSNILQFHPGSAITIPPPWGIAGPATVLTFDPRFNEPARRIFDQLRTGDVVRIFSPVDAGWREHTVISRSACGGLRTLRNDDRRERNWPRDVFLGGVFQLELITRMGETAYPSEMQTRVLEAAAGERLFDDLQAGDVFRIRYGSWRDWEEHTVVGRSPRGMLLTQRTGRKTKQPHSWSKRHNTGDGWKLELVRRAGEDTATNGEAAMHSDA
jgi:hypothetical protein